MSREKVCQVREDVVTGSAAFPVESPSEPRSRVCLSFRLLVSLNIT